MDIENWMKSVISLGPKAGPYNELLAEFRNLPPYLYLRQPELEKFLDLMFQILHHPNRHLQVCASGRILNLLEGSAIPVDWDKQKALEVLAPFWRHVEKEPLWQIMNVAWTSQSKLHEDWQSVFGLWIGSLQSRQIFAKGFSLIDFKRAIEMKTSLDIEKDESHEKLNWNEVSQKADRLFLDESPLMQALGGYLLGRYCNQIKFSEGQAKALLNLLLTQERRTMCTIGPFIGGYDCVVDGTFPFDLPLEQWKEFLLQALAFNRGELHLPHHVSLWFYTAHEFGSWTQQDHARLKAIGREDIVAALCNPE